MIRCTLVIAAMLVSAASLNAQVASPTSGADAPKSVPLAETFIAGESVERVPWASWESSGEDGATIVAVSGTDAVAAAPASASRYSRKSYVFPTGTIWVLEFEESQGGMLHPIGEETVLYMVEGTGTVGVSGEPVEIGAGDVVSSPDGVLLGTGDATVIAWDATGTIPRDEVRPMVVRASDTTLRQLGYWTDPDGKRVVVTTAEELEAAPPNAIRLDILSYAFDGNSVGVTTNYKGGPTNKTTGERDALLYITSGRMRFFQDDIDVIAGPGDAIRESAGHYHNWIRLEDSSFVGIGTAPLAAVDADNPNDYTGTGDGG